MYFCIKTEKYRGWQDSKEEHQIWVSKTAIVQPSEVKWVSGSNAGKKLISVNFTDEEINVGRRSYSVEEWCNDWAQCILGKKKFGFKKVWCPGFRNHITVCRLIKIRYCCGYDFALYSCQLIVQIIFLAVFIVKSVDFNSCFVNNPLLCNQ